MLDLTDFLRGRRGVRACAPRGVHRFAVFLGTRLFVRVHGFVVPLCVYGGMIFSLEEFNRVNQPRLRGVDALAHLQNSNIVPTPKKKYAWKIVRCQATRGHYVLVMERSKRADRRTKLTVDEEGSSVPLPAVSTADADETTETFLCVFDNVPGSNRLSEKQLEWLTKTLQNDQKSPLLEPPDNDAGIMCSLHTQPLTSVFFSSDTADLVVAGGEKELYLFVTEGCGVLYAWRWTRWRWNFLNRLSLSRSNPNMVVKMALYLPKEHTLLWHAHGQPGPIDEEASHAAAPKSLLFACSLNVTVVEVEETKKRQTHLVVGPTLTLGSFSPERMVRNKNGVWLRDGTQLCFWSPGKGTVLKQTFPTAPLLDTIHDRENDLICLFEDGRLVACREDRSTKIAARAAIQLISLPPLDPKPTFASPSSVGFAFVLRSIMVLDGNEVLVYDEGTGTLISRIPVVGDYPAQGLWSVGAASALCGIWSADRIWSVGFNQGLDYTRKLVEGSKASPLQRLQSEAISATLFGPSGHGAASMAMTSLAQQLEAEGVSAKPVWGELSTRLQNPALALAATYKPSGGTEVTSQQVDNFLDNYFGNAISGKGASDNRGISLAYFTPLNQMILPDMQAYRAALDTMADGVDGSVEDDDEKPFTIQLQEFFDIMLYEEDDNVVRKLLDTLEEQLGILFADDHDDIAPQLEEGNTQDASSVETTRKKATRKFGQGPHFQLLLVPERFPEPGKKEPPPPLFETMVRLYWRVRIEKLEAFVTEVAKRAPPVKHPEYDKDDPVTWVRISAGRAMFFRALSAIPPVFAEYEGDADVANRVRAALCFRAENHVGAVRLIVRRSGVKEAISFVNSMIFSKLGAPSELHPTLVQKQIFEELMLIHMKEVTEETKKYADDKTDTEENKTERARKFSSQLKDIFGMMPDTYKITQLIALMECTEDDIAMDDFTREQVTALYNKFIINPVYFGED